MYVTPIYGLYFAVTLGAIGMLMSSFSTQRDLQDDYLKCIQREAWNDNAEKCERTIGAEMRAHGAIFQKIMER